MRENRAAFKWLSKKPKQFLRPITTGASSAMNQSRFLAITFNSLKAREKSRVQGAIGFGFDSHWLKNWRDSFKPITERSNHNHVITFDSHLKIALVWKTGQLYHELFLTGIQFFCTSPMLLRQAPWWDCMLYPWKYAKKW